jgi:hypothetical protein
MWKDYTMTMKKSAQVPDGEIDSSTEFDSYYEDSSFEEDEEDLAIKENAPPHISVVAYDKNDPPMHVGMIYTKYG